MDSSISGNDPLAQHPAFADQLLLNGGNLHIGNFHAQIAPGDHNAVALGADFLRVIHAGAVFNFGNDLNVAAAVFPEEGFQFNQILPGGNEGGSHKIHPVFDAEQQVFLVLLGQIGTGHDLVGEAHALPVAHFSADHRAAVYVAALQFGYLKDHQSVADENPVAHIQILHKSLVVYADPGLVPFHIIRGEGKGIPLVHLHLSVPEGADPIFRSLGIQHNANGQIQLFPHLPDEVDFPLVLRMVSV